MLRRELEHDVADPHLVTFARAGARQRVLDALRDELLLEERERLRIAHVVTAQHAFRFLRANAPLVAISRHDHIGRLRPDPDEPMRDVLGLRMRARNRISQDPRELLDPIAPQG